MKRNEKFVIAINRELGSGGRTVGRKLPKDFMWSSMTKLSSRLLRKDIR